MRLTCKIGDFFFFDEVDLSKAKLIRDTVMGQMLNPQGGAGILRNEVQCVEFAHQNFDEAKAFLTGMRLNDEFKTTKKAQKERVSNEFIDTRDAFDILAAAMESDDFFRGAGMARRLANA